MTSHTKRIYMETAAGDIHTPISVFKKLSGQRFLLESSSSHHDSGRYSYLGMNPKKEVIFQAGVLSIRNEAGNITKSGQDLLDYFRAEMSGAKLDVSVPFAGGAVGYLGYDMVRQYESIGCVPEDPLRMPDAHFMLFSELFIFDHQLQIIHLAAEGPDAREKVQRMKELLAESGEVEREEEQAEPLSFTADLKREEFMRKVEEAKEAIKEGEAFQIVLSQRFQSAFSGNPFDLYRRLRLANPSPYMFYLDFGPYIVLGSSPESLISVRSRQVTLNPIAGTRPRGTSEAEDQQLASELINDEKELAEHRMLVDLARNDIGRVCETGTVSVNEMMNITRLQHVMHLTSKVTGRLKEEYSGLDALKACLPAGTVSGAPKIRAMELINQLESSKRGVYAGSVGYIGCNGELDMALAIRTMIIKDGMAVVQAGAGIVYDSDAEKEFEETKNKAKALVEVQQFDPVNR